MESLHEVTVTQRGSDGNKVVQVYPSYRAALQEGQQEVPANPETTSSVSKREQSESTEPLLTDEACPRSDEKMQMNLKFKPRPFNNCNMSLSLKILDSSQEQNNPENDSS